MKCKVFVTIFTIVVVALFTGCNRKSTAVGSNELIPLDSLEFDLKFNFRANHFGMLGDTAVYFSDTKTAKKIEIFGLDGEKRHTIKLDSIVSKMNLADFEIVSNDTILYIDKFFNILAQGNFEGELHKFIRVESDTVDYCQLKASHCASAIIGKGKLLLRSGLSFYKLPKGDTRVDDLELFEQSVWKNTKLEIVSGVFGKEQDMTIKKGFALYKHLFPTDSVKFFFDQPKYMYNNGSIYIWSKYSDKIMKLNEKLQLEEECKLLSENTNIGMSLLSLKDKEKYNEIAQVSGLVSNVYWDKYRSQFYVLIADETKTNVYKEIGYRPSTLLVCDEHFKTKREYSFSGEYYVPRISFVTKKGFAIKRKKKSNGKTVFDIFSL